MIEELKKEYSQVQVLAPIKSLSVSIWTPEEDQILSMAVKKYNGKNWEKVSQYFQNKSRNKCLHRWKKVLHPSLKKGKWSKEEDKVLKKYHRKFSNNWKIISKYLKNRTSKQCRERWKNSLDPNLKKGKWSQKEDQILIEKHSEYGNSWSHIQKFLPGRSANLVKNHWNSKFSKTIVSNNNYKKKRKRKKKILVHVGRQNFPSNLKNKPITKNQTRNSIEKPKNNINKHGKENNNTKLVIKTQKTQNKNLNVDKDNAFIKKKLKVKKNKNNHNKNQQQEILQKIQHLKKPQKKNIDCLITNNQNLNFKNHNLQVFKKKSPNKNNKKNTNNNNSHQNSSFIKQKKVLNNENIPKTPKKTKGFFNTSPENNFPPNFYQFETNDTFFSPNSQPIDDLDYLNFRFEISPIKKPTKEFSCFIRKRKTFELETYQINNLKESFIPNLESMGNIETLDDLENFGDLKSFNDFINISDHENIYEIKNPVKIQRKRPLKNQKPIMKYRPLSACLPPNSSSNPHKTKTTPYKLSYLKESQAPNLRLNSQNINTISSNFENNIMNKENELNPIIFNTSPSKKKIFNDSPFKKFYLSSFPQKDQLFNISSYLFNNFGNSKPTKNKFSEHPNTTILFQPIKHFSDQKYD
ncbi:snRNA-activating protein complex subunit 4 [Anaeramoeba flamelloides]|uniref:snRNA-activating protein complex subunit 4 n=1 Tax=Anaeramoeba flamelloides TaxID=1746091 RepID=A0ABQ8X4U0_9EUKA|nr:snRNA-activating protein complex subunit 4 [Anaeramoeba flamelloides]